MDQIITDLRATAESLEANKLRHSSGKCASAARRLEECRALLQRLANDEPAPEGETFQSWAKELLA